MLVRDRPDLEVLVLRRAPGAVFGPNATVFPGGAVDASDAAAADRVVGLDDAAASAEHGVAAGGLSYRVAAVRECFEEAGVLLARGRDGTPADPRPEWRDALNHGAATLADVLAAGDLVVDARDLHLFSHWLTPVGPPRRYDTWFFVARAPDGHDAVHDDHELVESSWVRPAELLEACADGRVELIFPTLRSVRAIARFSHARDLLAALAATPRDAAGRPYVVADASGERVVLPFDDVSRARHWTIPLPELHHREEARMLAEELG